MAELSQAKRDAVECEDEHGVSYLIVSKSIRGEKNENIAEQAKS